MKKILTNIKLSRYITSSLEDILPNLVQTIRKQKPEITGIEAEEIIRHLWNIIPQGNKHILTPWLVKVYLKNNGYIDENRARLLINTLYQAKTTFPNDFPKDFNINNYSNLDELERFLDPWIIKLSNIQEKHEEIEQSQELGEIVFQKGEYKILQIDNPEDIVKFLRINNVDSWCIKDMYYAKYYGPTWFLIKGNSIIGAYAANEGILRDRSNQPMKDPEAVRVFVEFLKQEGQEDKVLKFKLIVRLPMTKEEIDKVIDKGEYLYYLYRYYRLTPKQINKAIEKGKNLDDLYEYQPLTPGNIDRAIEKGEELYTLYNHQKLTPENIDKAMEKGYYYNEVYYSQSLTPGQIDKAIDIGKNLNILYTYQILTQEQIDKAIEKGKYLDILYIYQPLTSENIDHAIDNGEELAHLYISRKLTPAQIDKAIDIGKYLRTLYECQTLTSKQKKRIKERLKTEE